VSTKEIAMLALIWLVIVVTGVLAGHRVADYLGV
jgi:hypothetical protein